MSKANPRPDDESSDSPADAPGGTDPNSHAAGATGTATPEAETPEEELRRTLEERYDELEDRYDEVRELVEDYNRTAMEFIREHPGICIAGALGAGYVVGRLASRRWLT